VINYELGIQSLCQSWLIKNCPPLPTSKSATHVSIVESPTKIEEICIFNIS
jgi:hypothetical protein